MIIDLLILFILILGMIKVMEVIFDEDSDGCGCGCGCLVYLFIFWLILRLFDIFIYTLFW